MTAFIWDNAADWLLDGFGFTAAITLSLIAPRLIIAWINKCRGKATDFKNSGSVGGSIFEVCAYTTFLSVGCVTAYASIMMREGSDNLTASDAMMGSVGGAMGLMLIGLLLVGWIAFGSGEKKLTNPKEMALALYLTCASMSVSLMVSSQIPVGEGMFVPCVWTGFILAMCWCVFGIWQIMKTKSDMPTKACAVFAITAAGSTLSISFTSLAMDASVNWMGFGIALGLALIFAGFALWGKLTEGGFCKGAPRKE